MSKLTDLMEAIKEPNLTKEALEDLHQRMTNLFAQLQLSLADLEKEEARFYDTCDGISAVAAERKWDASERGQLLIERKRQDKALSKLLSSVKHRLFNTF